MLEINYENYEIVIVDNSTDIDTYTLIEPLLNANKQLRYVRTGDLSMSENWNIALQQASKDYLILCEDKCLLKKESLSILNSLIRKTGREVITFNYDAYYDSQRLMIKRGGEEVTLIKSKSLLSYVFKSSFDKYDPAPRLVNTCISREFYYGLLSKIPVLCHHPNPDYSASYFILQFTESILHLSSSLQIARFYSLYPKISYGNGNAYILKKSLFYEFINSLPSPLSHYTRNVPIKAFLVYSVLIDELIRSFEVTGFSHSFVIDRKCYYNYNINEIVSRMARNVNMFDELKATLAALSNESVIFKLYYLYRFFSYYLPKYFALLALNFIERTIPPLSRYISRCRGINNVEVADQSLVQAFESPIYLNDL